MPLPPHISEEIAEHLDAIGALFKDPKVTLVVRAPSMPDGKGDLVMTDDDLDMVIGAIQRRESEAALS